MTHTRNLAISLTISLAALSAGATAVAQTKSRPASETAIRSASDASAVGALLEFAYERGALYSIEASPQRITDIALEPGESLLSVSAGDTTRWIVGDARSGTGPSTQAHVLVKPNAANLATNIVVMTDRRVYHLELTSKPSHAMAAVSWRYPAEMMLANSAPASPVSPPGPLPVPAFAPERLNLRYRIDGDRPDWRPLAAFDDGQQVYIEMPARMRAMEAPPLFVIGDAGAELVNYRVTGNYYVVDRLFARAELRLGAGGKQKKVQIIRQTPIAGDTRG